LLEKERLRVPLGTDLAARALDLTSQLSQLHIGLGFDLQQDSNGKAKKLSRDYQRLSPFVQSVAKQAQQVCFEARHVIERQARDDEDYLHGKTTAVAPSASSSSTRGFRQQKLVEQMPSYSSADEKYAADVLQAVRQTEERAAQVNDLTVKVANLVAASTEPAARLTSHSSSARSDVISGLNELAELKKREAGKHFTRGTSVGF